MTSESSLWGTLKPKMPRGHYQRHEDKLSIGIPDLSYAFRHADRPWNGWIELKEADPRGRKPAIVNLRPEQRDFLTRRGIAGADCWMLLQIASVGYCWYYWSYLTTVDVNTLTWSEHRARCTVFRTKLTMENILDDLTMFAP